MMIFAFWLRVEAQDNTNSRKQARIIGRKTVLELASSVQTSASQVFSYATLGKSFYVSTLDLGFRSFVTISKQHYLTH